MSSHEVLGPPAAAAHPLPPERIETPSAVVDLEQAERNARGAVAWLAERGLAWRPHVKTHKNRTIARIQLEAGARGLTVATLREGEVMSALTDDLLLAYPQIGAAKRDRLARLAASVADLKVAVDSPEAVAEAGSAGAEAGREVGVLVELDVGMGRVGVGSPEAAVALASRAEEHGGTVFRGVLFYPGHIRMPAAAQAEPLREVAERLDRTLAALQRAGLAAEIVSGGSTPTLWQSHRIPGLTEVRAGTVIFHDRDMIELGVCTPDEVAYHVLATVVSTAVAGRAVVDAGSKALSREEFRGGGGGYGSLPGHPGVVVRSLSEEHGVLDLEGTDWRPRVGDRVRIVPNHVCVSVNLQDRLLAEVEGGYLPVPIEARGRLPDPD